MPSPGRFAEGGNTPADRTAITAALGLFAEAIDAFHRAGNVPQLIITLASIPALFERLDRLEPAAMLLGALHRDTIDSLSAITPTAERGIAAVSYADLPLTELIRVAISLGMKVASEAPG